MILSFREVGLLLYSQGFAISREEYIIREPAFCDWAIIMCCSNTRYPLDSRTTYLSEDVKTRVDRQTRTVHGLPFEPFLWGSNRHEFHPYHQLRDMSTAGVNNMSSPNDGGWVSSPSMVCIECSKSHGFLTRSSSWKGRDAGT